MSNWQGQLDAAIHRQFDDVVAMRRYLHQHPEVSGEEFETSKFIASRLEQLGITHRMGPAGRGVIADLSTNEKNEGPIFGIRGDIDALPIHDEKDVEYGSQRAGVMHACGHDAHAAMVFGVMAAFAELRGSFELPASLTIRAIFQPAEETCAGALEMIDANALDGVGGLIAAHVDPSRCVGAIGVRPGVMTAFCDHLRIVIHGVGGHGARPHKTRDPIAAAAQLIQTLYAQIPRSTDSQQATVLSIGQIVGGSSGNVIPDLVTLNGTLRTLDSAVRAELQQRIDRIAQAVASATRTTIETEISGAAEAVVNCPQLTDLIAESVSPRDGIAESVHVETMAHPSMGGEDFAFYGAHVPAAMFRLGIVSDVSGGEGLHTSKFDLDEQALKVGMRVMAHTAVAWSLRECDKLAKS